MSLLAHLVSRIDALDGEPAATRALAYLLRAEAPAKAFVRILEPAGLVSFDVGAVDAERQLPDTTQPDLSVCDGDGHLRLLVENKFWAPLTAAQPTRYLDFLPETPRSAALFVVPEARRKVLWAQLQDCLAAGPHRLKDRRTTQTLTWGRVGIRRLAVTSWRHVLDTLSSAAPDCSIWRCDLDQLRGLVEAQEDAEAFLPLRDEEVRATDVAQRIRNYTHLSPAIVGALATKNLATNPSPVRGGRDWVGQYLTLQGGFRVWLGVSYTCWNQWGLTPIWAVLDSRDTDSGIHNRLREAERVFKEARVDGNRWLCLPIRLMTGADRDQVIADAVGKLLSIAKTLDQNFPRPGNSGSGDPEAE